MRQMESEEAREAILAGEQFPEGLFVVGQLDFRGCKNLTTLPDKLIVHGTLDMEGCTSLRSLPDNLVVTGFLDLQGCVFHTNLPSNMYVEGSIFLTDFILKGAYGEIIINSKVPDSITQNLSGRKLSEVFFHWLLEGNPLTDSMIDSAENAEDEDGDYLKITSNEFHSYWFNSKSIISSFSSAPSFLIPKSCPKGCHGI